MELILLDNFYAMLRCSTGKATDAKLIDTSGNPHTMSADSIDRNPFRNTVTAQQLVVGTDSCFFYAVSDATIAHDIYNVTQIGTTSQYAVGTAHGYANVVTITSNADATITHLVAVRNVYYSSGYTATALIFALKLDTPVQLNSGNNYTANFAFSIEF